MKTFKNIFNNIWFQLLASVITVVLVFFASSRLSLDNEISLGKYEEITQWVEKRPALKPHVDSFLKTNGIISEEERYSLKKTYQQLLINE